jgi:hypothetical protein
VPLQSRYYVIGFSEKNFLKVHWPSNGDSETQFTTKIDIFLLLFFFSFFKIVLQSIIVVAAAAVVGVCVLQ